MRTSRFFHISKIFNSKTTNKNSAVKGKMMTWSDEQSIRKMLEIRVRKRATYLLQGGHFHTVVGSIYGRINVKNHGSNFYVPVPYQWIWVKPTLFSCSLCNQQTSSIFCTFSFKHKINNISAPLIICTSSIDIEL